MNMQSYSYWNERNYYPSIIDAKRTEEEIILQTRIMRKMVHFLEWKEFIPKDLLQIIASFCFHNPIVFKSPIYVALRDPELTSKKQCFFVYNHQKSKGFKIDVMGSWQGIVGPLNNIMNLANYFCHFLPLQNMEQSDSKYTYEKWNVVGKKAYLFNINVRTINDYHKKGHMNKCITQAFSSLMSNDILLLKVNGVKYIYLSNQGHHKQIQIEAQNDLSFGLSLRDGRWKMRLSNQNYAIYKESIKLMRRVKQKIFTNQFSQLQLTDIYFTK